MASNLLMFSRTSAAVGIGLGLSFTLLPTSPFRALPMQFQYVAPDNRAGADQTEWTMSPQDPFWAKQTKTTRGNGILTASNMRQVSLGSVLGLVAGVGLRAFSRVLVVLLGMGLVAVEWAASKGYNILPVHRLQKYVKSVDLEKAVSRNMPFKVTFGVTMALAAFAEF
ncbi:hypothetical protein BDW59DRAFT_128567 [Aspergillus cavernicola]|uniref:FUN14 family-domain-containing protein n=1 Tax=Aspergillus cavernicola TaxID=176166 RepID=A0ABR4HSI0_9EURO